MTDAIPLAPGENPPIPGAVKVSSEDMAERHHSARTKARKAALDILFEADVRSETIDEALRRHQADPTRLIRPFTAEIVEGVAGHLAEVDLAIGEALTGDWEVDRMPRVDRNLARVCAWELLYSDIDARVAISEALELADELSTDESVHYLNGVLGRVASHTRSCDE